MITCTCIEKFRDKNGNIEGYKLQDELGNCISVNKNQLKNVMLQKKLNVTNLKLTTDNKLIDKNEQDYDAVDHNQYVLLVDSCEKIAQYVTKLLGGNLGIRIDLSSKNYFAKSKTVSIVHRVVGLNENYYGEYIKINLNLKDIPRQMLLANAPKNLRLHEDGKDKIKLFIKLISDKDPYRFDDFSYEKCCLDAPITEKTNIQKVKNISNEYVSYIKEKVSEKENVKTDKEYKVLENSLLAKAGKLAKSKKTLI